MASTIVLLVTAVVATVAAAFSLAGHHVAASALAGLMLATAAISENRQLMAGGATKNVVSAATARHLGSVWAWAGLSLFFLNALGFVDWPAWWLYCLVFTGLAVVCLVFGSRTTRDLAAGREDWAMLTLARRLTQLQLVGMIAALAVLITSGEAGCMIDPRQGCENWAAKNLFLFGEIALALISANALWTSRHMGPRVQALRN